jgi:hypothetical protein
MVRYINTAELVILMSARQPSRHVVLLISPELLKISKMAGLVSPQTCLIGIRFGNRDLFLEHTRLRSILITV